MEASPIDAGRLREIVSDAVRRDREEERKGYNRAYAAEKPQSGFVRHETAAVGEVLKKEDREELLGAALDLLFYLEHDNQRLREEQRAKRAAELDRSTADRA